MFRSIFLFEIKYWLKSWAFYIYIALFFLISMLLMMSSLGVFDNVKATTSTMTYMNAPITLNMFVESMNQLLYFLFPAIIGSGIYRDYKYNVHNILYSYPFTKSSYLLGKFLSGFVIVFMISIFIGLGLFLATLVPFANPQLIGPNTLWNYAQVYLINIIPNMLFMGMIVFVITTLTRSVYIGFIAVVIMMIIQGVMGSLATNADNEILAILIDPTGLEAINYYTKYWTFVEYNTNDLPLEKWFLINRGIWLGVTFLMLLLVSKLFTFSHAPISFGRKAKGERLVKENFVGLSQFTLPKVTYNFDLQAHLKNMWSFMKIDLRFMTKNVVFLILIGVGLLLMILMSSQGALIYGTNVKPVTRIMLEVPSSIMQFFIVIITFLGAGQIVHRGEISKMGGLIDSTAVPNWVLFTSKFFALIIIQAILLMVVAIAGITIQAFQGFYQFEIGLYLKSLLGISWVWYIIWGGLALAVQTFFKNYLLGFFLLIVFFFFGDQISNFGVEQPIFYFNRLPTPYYSDLDGFGSGLFRYFTFALYWLLFISFLAGLTLLFWRRGATSSIKERCYIAKRRINAKVLIPTVLSFAGFIALGSFLYYENKILNEYISPKQGEEQQVEYEKKYKQYSNLLHPRVVDVKVDVDLYPGKLDFEARGVFTIKNKHPQSIDSIMVMYDNDLINTIEIKGAQLLSEDEKMGVRFYRFDKPLDSGAISEMTFVIKNKPNTHLRTNSPINHNGTFLSNSSFPIMGYADMYEIQSNRVRKKYNLPPKERMAKQSDEKALQNTYISGDSDWITFEATVSTSKDQIAIAPGYLQKEWEEGNRRYFHYKMDRKMLNFYAFNSGRYEVAKDKWNDINIEVYYHKPHHYNIDRMIKGVKKALEYSEANFSPYQHNQVRIIEFPVTKGTFAQSFANTIPFSEGIGFIADVDDEDKNGVDYPFSITVHEVAHQWWAHQVIGANVQGATMLSESLSEYTALKVLEHEYGKPQMRKFLQDALDQYLQARSGEINEELPLMYNENQQHIHYNKGSLVFYAMSDYLGEKILNNVLSTYIQKVAFQEPPYTTSTELVNDIRKATPDSLKYLIKDMFETITLYDNYITNTSAEETNDGKFKVNFTTITSKYRADGRGERIFEEGGKTLTFQESKNKKIQSLPLADYIDIGIFTKSESGEEKVLYLEKAKITDIKGVFSIIVNEKPTEVGIDPYNKLIDTRSFDNRKAVSF
ncbi:MAG: M1 family aminopeptidase [Brumimicrobium sp.]